MAADRNERQAFDPSKFLTKVNGNDYLEVKWRLLWFRTDHPDGEIETELVEHRDGVAVFRARVRVPGVVRQRVGEANRPKTSPIIWKRPRPRHSDVPSLPSVTERSSARISSSVRRSNGWWTRRSM
mgnify:CR=1 FL=1